MNNFFSNFDQVLYNFDFGQNNQKNVVMTNFTRNVEFQEITKILEYNRYYINDGQKPDSVAYELYDDPYKHWILYLINPELKKGWPMSDLEIDKHIENLYSGLSFIVDVNEIVYTIPLQETNDIENIDIFVLVGSQYVKTNSKIRGFDPIRRGLIVSYDNHVVRQIETYGSLFLKPNNEYSQTDLLKWDDVPLLNNTYYQLHISKASSSLLKNAIYEFTDISYRDGVNALQSSGVSPEFITFSENIIRENEKNKFIKVLPKTTVPILETQYLNLLRDANR